MRNTILAAAAAAAITAGFVMVVAPSGNEVNAQATSPTYSKAQAQCILHHLSKVNTDRAALLLQSACSAIHTARLSRPRLSTCYRQSVFQRA